MFNNFCHINSFVKVKKNLGNIGIFLKFTISLYYKSSQDHFFNFIRKIGIFNNNSSSKIFKTTYKKLSSVAGIILS